jgi:NitT/TauT family transport system ATP-binding protein
VFYVQADRVRKIYNPGPKQHEALSSVSFTAAPGEFISILGPSGCGKSTLLMMVAGLESVTAGQLSVGGHAVEGPRTDFGVIFQDATLLPWMTAIENVLFPIHILKRSKAEYRDRAENLLRMVGLEDSFDRRPHTLSGGMKQRVAICRALIHEPELLLMDEPFSALDAISRDEMNVELLEIWDKYRKTVLFVTHSIREAVFLSDRVLVMGGRPSTIICDVRCPFPRPRDFSIGEQKDFNDICKLLREKIQEGYGPRLKSARPPATRAAA